MSSTPSFKPTAQDCARALIHKIEGETVHTIWNPVAKRYQPMTPGQIAKGRRYLSRSDQRVAHAEAEFAREQAELARQAREARQVEAAQRLEASRKVYTSLKG